MKKNLIVTFDQKGANIQTVEDITPYKNRPDVLINPDRKNVHGLPPHRWANVDGRLMPASAESIAVAEKSIKKEFVVQNKEFQKKAGKESKLKYWLAMAALLAGQIYLFFNGGSR